MDAWQTLTTRAHFLLVFISFMSTHNGGGGVSPFSFNNKKKKRQHLTLNTNCKIGFYVFSGRLNKFSFLKKW